MKLLFDSIDKLPKLKTLYLIQNEITNEGGESLLKNVEKCRNLEKLFIKENDIYNDNFKSALRQNHGRSNIEID